MPKTKPQHNLRVVFDTNIYIMAALKPKSLAAKLLSLSTQEEFKLFISEEILEELINELKNKKFKNYDGFIQVIKVGAQIIKTSKKANDIELRDKKDQIVLDCALNSNAYLIITNDQDLISIKRYKNIGITHISSFKRYFRIP